MSGDNFSSEDNISLDWVVTACPQTHKNDDKSSTGKISTYWSCDRGKIVSDSVCNAASDITFITVMLHQTQPHYQATALLRRAGAVRWTRVWTGAQRRVFTQTSLQPVAAEIVEIKLRYWAINNTSFIKSLWSCQSRESWVNETERFHFTDWAKSTSQFSAQNKYQRVTLHAPSVWLGAVDAGKSSDKIF